MARAGRRETGKQASKSPRKRGTKTARIDQPGGGEEGMRIEE